MENLIVQKENSICQVIINRPKKLNALNKQTIEELKEAFTQLNQDTQIRAVILTGTGEKSFVAGADIEELSKLTPDQAQEVSRFGQGVFSLIENSTKPVIAAVNGFALGGGLELALSAHFRIASENARFGLPEVNLGLIPGYGGTQRLAREVGKGRATQMISSAQMIDAPTALSWGLVNEVVPLDQLIPQTLKIASEIASKAPLAIKSALEAIGHGFASSYEDGYAHEAELFGKCFSFQDTHEGISAFLEKRAAKFEGH